MVQVACRAGNFDDTALDRDRPVTLEGILPALEVNRTQYGSDSIYTCVH